MTPLKQTLEFEETVNRFENCVWYETCLDKAARMRLESFSCVGCENFIHSPCLDVMDFLVKQDTYVPETPSQTCNWSKFGALLSKKMRKNNIPVVGFADTQKKETKGVLNCEV